MGLHLFYGFIYFSETKFFFGCGSVFFNTEKGSMRRLLGGRGGALDSNTFFLWPNHSKILTKWLYHRVMSPNDADGMANSVDSDQTAAVGAV